MPPLPSYNSDRGHYVFGLSVCMYVRAYVHVCVRAEAFLDRLANLCIAQKHRCGLFLQHDVAWSVCPCAGHEYRAKTPEPIDMPSGMGRADPCGPEEPSLCGSSRWHYLANTIELYVRRSCGSDAGMNSKPIQSLDSLSSVQ